MEFETITSELMFQGKILDVYKDTIRFANGHEAVREIIRHRGAAAVVPLTENGEVILVEQFRYAVQKDTLEIPAGLLETGEEPLACAKRELEEETGYRAGEVEFLFDFYSSPGYCTEKISIYLAKNLIPSEQHLDDDEFVTIQSYPLEDAIEMIREGKITDGKTIAALMAVYATEK